MPRIITPIATRLLAGAFPASSAVIVIGAGLATSIRLRPDGGSFRLTSFDQKAFFHDNGACDGEDDLTPPRRRPLPAKGARVISLASGPAVFTKLLELPRMPQGEAARTLRHTEQDSAPFPLDEAAVGAWIAGPGSTDGWMRALMAAMKRDEILKLSGAARAGGLKSSVVSVAAAAIGALVRHSAALDTDGPLLFVHVEDNLTGIHIFNNMAPIYTREIPIGAGNPSGAAEDVFPGSGTTRGGWPLSPWEVYKITDLPHAPLKRTAAEISRSVNYFRRSHPDIDLRRAHLVGSLARVRGMDGYLGRAAGIPFDVYDPLDDFVIAEDDVFADGAAAAVQIGAALDGGESLNLLSPAALGRDHAPPGGWGLWAFALGMAVAAVFSYQLYQGSSELDEKIAAMSASVDRLRERRGAGDGISARLSSINGSVRALEAELASYPPLRGSGTDWPEVFRDIASATPDDIALTRVEFDFAGNDPLARIEGMAKGGDEREKINMLLDFVRGIESGASYKRARVEMVERVSGGGEGRFVFAISAALAAPDSPDSGAGRDE